MYKSMTFATSRLNNKRLAIIRMMIMLSLFSTIGAFMAGGRFQFSASDSMSYSILSFYCSWMALSVFFCTSALSYFAFFALVVTFSIGLAFKRLFVSLGCCFSGDTTFFRFIAFLLGFLVTGLALVVKPIFSTIAPVKFRKRLEFFTHATLFHIANYTKLKGFVNCQTYRY